jgi:putative two-component system response regulator
LLALPAILVQRAVSETVKLRIDTHEALASLVEIVELRDPYTAGHSRRVAANARLLALRMGLTAEEADVIESAGRVHDIGKVAIDPAILTKPGMLTDAEFAEMQLHPTHGANVVERFAAYRQGSTFVRHHHEAWDGTGYPDKLVGEAIPLGARILAVVDSFDALTSDRPYRRGFSVARARAVLQDGSGRQWASDVVAAWMAQLDEAPGDVWLFRRDEQSATVYSEQAHDSGGAGMPDVAA